MEPLTAGMEAGGASRVHVPEGVAGSLANRPGVLSGVRPMTISLLEPRRYAMFKSRYPAPEHYVLVTSAWRRCIDTFNVEDEEPIEAAVSWLQHLQVADPSLYTRLMADAEDWVERERARLQAPDCLEGMSPPA